MEITKGKTKNQVNISIDLEKDIKTLKTGKKGYYERFILQRDGHQIRLQVLGWIKTADNQQAKVVQI